MKVEKICGVWLVMCLMWCNVRLEYFVLCGARCVNIFFVMRCGIRLKDFVILRYVACSKQCAINKQ